MSKSNSGLFQSIKDSASNVEFPKIFKKFGLGSIGSDFKMLNPAFFVGEKNLVKMKEKTTKTYLKSSPKTNGGLWGNQTMHGPLYPKFSKFFEILGLECAQGLPKPLS